MHFMGVYWYISKATEITSHIHDENYTDTLYCVCIVICVVQRTVIFSRQVDCRFENIFYRNFICTTMNLEVA